MVQKHYASRTVLEGNDCRTLHKSADKKKSTVLQKATQMKLNSLDHRHENVEVKTENVKNVKRHI